MTGSLKKPLVYLITKGESNSSNFHEKAKEILETIRAAVDAGVSLIQIREKQLSARSLFELAKNAAEITAKSKTKLLVNERADIAAAAGADGVHLTALSIPTAIIRQNFCPEFIIGVSVHSLEKAEAARKNGADFATFAPVIAVFSRWKVQDIKAVNPPVSSCRSRTRCK